MKIEKAIEILKECGDEYKALAKSYPECTEIATASDMAIHALNGELEKIKLSDIWQDMIIIQAENKKLKEQLKELKADLTSYELTHEKIISKAE